ncbi:response regulator [Candidatus Thiosymbion oneisti]|uniref:response regulator n=1 Tax=Candidatus Thiosymbion oneisti TaxID=589554 RepID=UPI00106217AC|nr:response regulator [Candidatus Thiosymbion oneisti]
MTNSQATAYPQKPAQSPSDCRILAAEDNPALGDVISGLLRILGYSVDVASDGEQAVKQWRENSYHLILMDCVLPKLDGFEATRRIRAEEKSTEKKVPIVGLTSDTDQEKRKRGLAAGMDGFRQKPITVELLEEVLEQFSLR